MDTDVRAEANGGLVECFKCHGLTNDPHFAFDGSQEGKGLCKMCNAIDNVHEEMRCETEHKGEPYQIGSHTYFVGKGEKIQCPHCRFTYGPDWEDADHYGQAGEDEWFEEDCPECEKSFEIQVQVKYERTTRKTITYEEAVAEWESRVKAM